jgi:hypothetical protein
LNENICPANRIYFSTFEDDRRTPSRPFKAVARVKFRWAHHEPAGPVKVDHLSQLGGPVPVILGG